MSVKGEGRQKYRGDRRQSIGEKRDRDPVKTETAETENQRQEARGENTEKTEKESQMRRETGLQKRQEIENRGEMKRDLESA